MSSIATHRDLQSVRKLPFCYLCGIPFRSDEKRHRDHVPPKTCFAVADRQPLILSSHQRCNSERSVTDKQIGQIIGLKLGKKCTKRDWALDLKFVGPSFGAVMNVNIHDEVWRWVRGFHAALYRIPFPKGVRGALETPFPSAPLRDDGRVMFDQIKPQHLVIVETIKINRAKQNLDTIRCNNGKLKHECVWCLSDDERTWLCFFAIDLYGWKDLGNQIFQPARGCAGFYTLPDCHAPPTATKGLSSTIIMPNIDELDPFGR